MRIQNVSIVQCASKENTIIEQTTIYGAKWLVTNGGTTTVFYPTFEEARATTIHMPTLISMASTVPYTRLLALERTYPLTKQLKEAYLKVGVKPIHDHNGGDHKGMAPYVENWHNGKRQPAGKAYGLTEVEMLTNITVKCGRLKVEAGGSRKATGVQLASAKSLKPDKKSSSVAELSETRNCSCSLASILLTNRGSIIFRS